MGAKRGEVGLAEGRLLAVECLHERLHVCGAAVGGHETVELLGEGDETGVVHLADGDERQGQGGVDAVVEQRHALESLLHDAAFVDDAIDALRAFVLVDVDHQVVSACGGFPVDGAEVGARRVFLDVLELRLVAHAAYALGTRLGEVVADGQQLILSQTEE